MSNAEIILVQLKHFQSALDTSINEHYRKLVIIHGVGNGRLKQEVRTILSSYKNLQFHDASYSKYGFGATEILIS
jgi:dsDNA-specific endonuclease/ATPase MutS2